MTGPAWVEHAIWWQIYPLGFVGAFPADPAPTAEQHRLGRITEWLDHAVELGALGQPFGIKLRHHRERLVVEVQ